MQAFSVNIIYFRGNLYKDAMSFESVSTFVYHNGLSSGEEASKVWMWKRFRPLARQLKKSKTPHPDAVLGLLVCRVIGKGRVLWFYYGLLV